MDPVAFTLREGKLTSELLTPCKVGDSQESSLPVITQNMLQVSALWDTGATGSVISVEAAAKLNLKPVSQCIAYHAQGQSTVNVYLVDLVLPNNILVRDVRVTEGRLNGFGMLIGMDIINLGDFALTHRDNNTVFSFQIPATHDYDFVKQIQHQQESGQNQKKKRK